MSCVLLGIQYPGAVRCWGPSYFNEDRWLVNFEMEGGIVFESHEDCVLCVMYLEHGLVRVSISRRYPDGRMLWRGVLSNYLINGTPELVWTSGE